VLLNWLLNIVLLLRRILYMSRSIFGWSLPPGCSRTPGEEDEGPCAVCGGDPEGSGPGACICPPCIKCEEVGDPDCYEGIGAEPYQHHGMVCTPEQVAGREKLEAALAADAAAEAEHFKQFEAEADDYYAEQELNQ
jgi:hypothetical protein